MTITQTVEVPANHRLVINVPSEVPAGRVVITFTPEPDEKSDEVNEDGLHLNGVCPICAAKNYMPNAKTIAVIEECDAMIKGEIPSTLRSFDTFEEMMEDLDRDDPDDE